MPKVHAKGRTEVGNKFLDTIINRVDGTNSFVLGNAKSAGVPIVYCSEGFYELTGFRRSQVLGKRSNCSFLYGPLTKKESKQKIEDALQFQHECRIQLCLYAKDGDAFWCKVEMLPIMNENQEVALFLISYEKCVRKETVVDLDSQINQDSTADLASQTGSKERTRGREILCNLTRQFKSRRKKMGQLDKFQEAVSGQQAIPEYKVEVQKGGKGIILHYGFIKVLWDWLIMICTFYIAIMVPFNAAFIVGEFDRTSIYADVAVEIIFGIDIVLNFRTTYVSDTGQVVYDPRLIALNYIRQWFFMDLLAAIPFDLLYAFQVETGTLIPLLKVARLLRLIRLFQKMDRYSQYASVVIILLLSMFTLTAHWLACVWYSIGKFEMQTDPNAWKVGWLHDLSEVLYGSYVNRTTIPDMWSCYLTSLYFTCSSLTTVGFGNVSASTNAEKIFSICVMLVGAMMYALVFGNVTAIVQRAYARRATFHMKSNDLKDFYHTYNIPKPLKRRIQDYFQSTWTMNNGINFNELFADFPEEIRGEISMHLYKEILSLPLFKGVTHGCVKAISQQIRRSFCVPGEYLIHRGDAISYLYFIISGSLEILRDDRVIALLGKGDLFGVELEFEDLVLTSSYSVKSLTYCELQCISLLEFINVLALYPNVADQLAKAIQRELTFNLKDIDDNELMDDATSIVDTKSLCHDNEELSRSESNVQMEKKDGSLQNSIKPINFQTIVKKATRRKTFQNTLKRKIHTLKKAEKLREETHQVPTRNEPIQTLQFDMTTLSKEIQCIRQELRATIELLCSMTNVPKDTILCSVSEPQPLVCTKTESQGTMNSEQDTNISDTLFPHSPKLTISTKDLEDITSETGISEVTPDENSINKSEENSENDCTEFERSDTLSDSSLKMEEGESPRSPALRQKPRANKSPHINVVFEPNLVKKKCLAANATGGFLQYKDNDDNPENPKAIGSTSKSTSNPPFSIQLGIFAEEEEKREEEEKDEETQSKNTKIVTETTDV